MKEGQWAEVTVFDLEALQDQATCEAPMGSPAGIDYVLGNGVVTMDSGKHTGARAGMILFGPGRQ